MRPMNNRLDFLQKELLAVAGTVGLTASRLESWERRDRGVLPAAPVGSGNRRRYSLDDAVYLSLIAILAPRLPALALACSVATAIKDDVVSILLDWSNADRFDNAPDYVVYEAGGGWRVTTLSAIDADPSLGPTPGRFSRFLKRAIQPNYSLPIILSSGPIAMTLGGGLSDVLSQRKGHENRVDEARVERSARPK